MQRNIAVDSIYVERSLTLREGACIIGDNGHHRLEMRGAGLFVDGALYDRTAAGPQVSVQCVDSADMVVVTSQFVNIECAHAFLRFSRDETYEIAARYGNSKFVVVDTIWGTFVFDDYVRIVVRDGGLAWSSVRQLPTRSEKMGVRAATIIPGPAGYVIAANPQANDGAGAVFVIKDGAIIATLSMPESEGQGFTVAALGRLILVGAIGRIIVWRDMQLRRVVECGNNSIPTFDMVGDGIVVARHGSANTEFREVPVEMEARAHASVSIVGRIREDKPFTYSIGSCVAAFGDVMLDDNKEVHRIIYGR